MTFVNIILTRMLFLPGLLHYSDGFAIRTSHLELFLPNIILVGARSTHMEKVNVIHTGLLFLHEYNHYSDGSAILTLYHQLFLRLHYSYFIFTTILTECYSYWKMMCIC